MIDQTAPTFGLPECLRIPIAAASVADIELYVGRVVLRVEGRDRTNAVCVEPHDRALAAALRIRSANSAGRAALAQNLADHCDSPRPCWPASATVRVNQRGAELV